MRRQDQRHLVEILGLIALLGVAAFITSSQLTLSPLVVGSLVGGYFLINIVYVARRTQLHPERIAHFGLAAAMFAFLVLSM